MGRILSKSESEKLAKQIRERVKKRGIEKVRKEHFFVKIPEELFFILKDLNRAKYRSIVCASWMSLFWDGWTGKKKKGVYRRPTKKVMFTRRLMQEGFGYQASTIQNAIDDLLDIGQITIAQESVFTGDAGKNRGRCFYLKWMEKNEGKKIHIYWGLMISDTFRSLDITLQAILILLHSLHMRARNQVYIRPSSLEKYGVHRNRMSEYIDALRHAGLIQHIDGHRYEFTWFDDNGRPDFECLYK